MEIDVERAYRDLAGISDTGSNAFKAGLDKLVRTVQEYYDLDQVRIEKLRTSMKAEEELTDSLLDTLAAQSKNLTSLSSIFGDLATGPNAAGLSNKSIQTLSSVASSLQSFSSKLGTDSIKKLSEAVSKIKFNDLISAAEQAGDEFAAEAARGLSDKLSKQIEGAELFDQEFAGIGKTIRKLDRTGLFPGLAKNFREARSESAQLYESTGKGLSTFQVLSKTISGTTFGLAALTGIAVSLWRTFQAVDKEAAELKRQIGTWEYSASVANTQFASSVDWLRQATVMSKELGINVKGIFSDKEIAQVAAFKNLTGATAEEASILAQRAKLSGEGIREFRDHITAGANEGNRLNRSIVTLRAVQDSVLRVSNAIALSYGNSAERLAKAAVAAKNLGMELGDVESISKNLLQFESSIQAEMEAQLLTGHRTNLMRAREYALVNDLEGVAREITRQGYSAAEFSRMNLIQQDSIAKSLGMSREQLAKALILRELNNGADKEALANATHTTTKQIEAMSATEKWSKAMEILRQSFAPILGILADIVRGVAWVVGGLGGIIGKLTGTKIGQGIVLGIVAITVAVRGLRVALTGLGSTAGRVISGLTSGLTRAGTGIGRGIGAMLRPLSNPELLLGVAVLSGVVLALSGSFLMFSNGLTKLSTIDWSNFAGAGKALASLGAGMVALAGATSLSLPGLIAFRVIAAPALKTAATIASVANGKSLDETATEHTVVNLETVERLLAEIRDEVKIKPSWDWLVFEQERSKARTAFNAD